MKYKHLTFLYRYHFAACEDIYKSAGGNIRPIEQQLAAF